MALETIALADLNAEHLHGLVDLGVPEGVTVDFKTTTYGGRDDDVKEFLKDVSSFANAAGGHLFIGVKEAQGIATALTPLSLDVDKELQRLESYVRDGIEPRILGVGMRAIPVDGGTVIVIRVPKSWNLPHRVSARKTNRIYGRNSTGAYEVSMDELRAMILTGATAHERVRAFRAERLATLAANMSPVMLAANKDRLVLHLVPQSVHTA